MVIVSVVLMDRYNEGSTIHNRGPSRQRLPDKPPIPIASADDQCRDVVVEAFWEDEIINEMSRLQQSRFFGAPLESLLPTGGAKLNRFPKICIPALRDE